MSSDGVETERVSVSTYVPAYQRATWATEAESMGVSRSEYVRLMVQAGRRSFDLDGTDGSGPQMSGSGHPADGMEPDDETVTDHNPGEGREADPAPQGDGLQERVLELLEPDGHLGWDELVAGLTADIEDRLEAALDDLQSAGRVRHSGRHGGYTVVEDE